eukprot:TRINITY_DN68434_c0_g1_i1.p1 TRINITY_DN68434_c0_g1~~TRINITY_DN68434_c0_g1_i1.p1  ORF type:complete len:259 (+),score=43.66 TRINITY_DN68434_c0_g1_i1:48-824(+)
MVLAPVPQAVPSSRGGLVPNGRLQAAAALTLGRSKLEKPMQCLSARAPLPRGVDLLVPPQLVPYSARSSAERERTSQEISKCCSVDDCHSEGLLSACEQTAAEASPSGAGTRAATRQQERLPPSLPREAAGVDRKALDVDDTARTRRGVPAALAPGGVFYPVGPLDKDLQLMLQDLAFKLKSQLHPVKLRIKLRHAFRSVNSKNEGIVTQGELRAFCDCLGFIETFADQLFDALSAEAADGQIELERFHRLITCAALG